MRRAAAIVILICILYFIGGLLAVYFGFYNWSKYLEIGGVVGAAASIVGLLSFTQPRLTSDDLQQIEVESLHSIANTSEELKKLESRKEDAKDEIDNLAKSKKEMELLVKKASMSLFLQEQKTYYERKVNGIIEGDLELQSALQNLNDTNGKLEVLEVEIQTDPNAALLEEVVLASRVHRSEIDDVLNELPPLARTLVSLLRDLGKAYAGLFQALLK